MNKKSLSLKLSLGLSLGILGNAVMAQDVIMTIADTDYVVTVDENTQAGKLFLNSLPLTLNFENFGSSERVAYFPKRLDMDGYDSHLSVKRGDMTYYVPWGNLAVFRKAYSSPSDLAPIGSMPENAISALEQSGDSEVSFKIK
ncbi:cyclophilin-like fold protein [Succinatimonas hippei]|uniref:cyclophilin-like fold protein n=1 Tax=Succinatimonas hippei TaxID=626938 RepID=UPI0026F18488|nr:cyclophilin-like fold protein [Succinatimonas hippei]